MVAIRGAANADATRSSPAACQDGEIDIGAARGASINLKIEIFEGDHQEKGEIRYLFRVFRYDMFRLAPLPFGAERDDADHEILVADSMFDRTAITAGSVEDAWNIFVKRLRHQLSLD